MKGAKPNPTGKVVPMKGDDKRPMIDPPVTMTETGRAIWDEMAPIVHRLDRLHAHFKYQFASYCESVATFIAATNDIEMNGKGRYYEVKTRNGLQQKRTMAFNVQQDAMNQMRRDAALFGLSPVDESRLDAGGQGDLFDQIKSQLTKGTGTDGPD